MSIEVAGIALKVDSTDALTAKQNLDAMAKAGAASASSLGAVESKGRGVAAALASGASGAAQEAKALSGVASEANATARAFEAMARKRRMAEFSSTPEAFRTASAIKQNRLDLEAQYPSKKGDAFGSAAERAAAAAAAEKAAASTRVLSSALSGQATAGKTAAAATAQVASTAATTTAALSATATAAAASTRGIASTAGGARTAADGLRATGQQAKLTGQQTAQLSAQLQDFFVQVQAGGSPLTAFIQQGSQLSAVFGGVAPALRAVGTVLLSTATAYAALAAAGLGLGAAFVVGREQSADLARAILLSGNAAGVTEGRFNALAQSIAASTSTTIGSTRDALQELVGSGRISADTLETAAKAVQLLSKATGQASTEIAQQFAKAADGPAKFAEETNKRYNFLTASQLEYIRNLEEQGRGQEALSQTFALLIPRLEQAAGATTGLGRALSDAKNEVSAFFDALVQGLGRTDTAEQQLGRVQAQIKELQKAGQKGYVFGASLDELQQQEAGLQRTIAGQREVAYLQAQDRKRQNSKTEWNKLEEGSLSRQAKLSKELANANSLADQAGISLAERQKVLANIRQKFDGGQNKASLANDLAAIKSAEAEKLATYRNTESVIDALRSAGLIREGDYYDAKRAYVEIDRKVQEEALNAEIARLQQFKGTAVENLEVRKQIAEAQTRLAILGASAAAKTTEFNIKQLGSINALSLGFKELEFAAVEAYQATQRRIEFAVGTQDKGDSVRQRLAEEFSIRERYTRQLERLQAEQRAGAFQADQSQYAKRRQLLLDNQEFELAQTAEAYRQLDEGRKKWETGFAVGVSNVLEGASDTARRTQELTEDTFRGLGDALTDVFVTGAADWSKLERTIVSGITRIIIEQQAIRPIAAYLAGDGGGGVLGSVVGSLIGAFTGGGGSGMPDGVPTRGGRAAGGRVEAGGLYPVNELASHGPGEILTSGGRQYLMARQDGMVQPMSAAGGGLQQVINFHSTGPIDRRTQQQLATAAGRGAQTALARNG